MQDKEPTLRVRGVVKVRLLAFPANIRLGCKRLEVTKTSADEDPDLITVVKSFIVNAYGWIFTEPLTIILRIRVRAL
jgi:hypothetical protein